MFEDMNNLGQMIRQRRVTMSLTLQQLGDKSGVSPSHLGRIERGERYPTAHVLRKLAEPLGLKELELFVSANFLSPQTSLTEGSAQNNALTLDPYVANVLSQEPVEVQRTVVTILSVMKSMAKNLQSDLDGGNEAR